MQLFSLLGHIFFSPVQLKEVKPILNYVMIFFHVMEGGSHRHQMPLTPFPSLLNVSRKVLVSKVMTHTPFQCLLNVLRKVHQRHEPIKTTVPKPMYPVFLLDIFFYSQLLTISMKIIVPNVLE